MKSSDEKAARQLLDVRRWAQDKIAGGEEPPWAWYQYMKLTETIDAILGGADCVVTMENSQQSELRPGVHLRLVDSTCSPDNVQRHPSDETVQMPM